MPARRAAGDADSIGVDLVVLGVIADESHGPVHVFDDLGNREPGLAAVDDREDGVAPLEKLCDRLRVDRFVAREPAAADDPDDRRAVGIVLRREDVHRQRHAVLSTVDHVGLAVERGRLCPESDLREWNSCQHGRMDRRNICDLP